MAAGQLSSPIPTREGDRARRGGRGGYQFAPEIRADASFTGFDFTVNSQAVGDQLLPNTPSKKATFSVTYTGQQGLDANVLLRLVDGYQWAAGVSRATSHRASS